MSEETEPKNETPPTAPASPPSPVHDPEALAEGEEEIPRGAGVMAVVRWLLVALMAVAAAGSILHVTGALASLRGEKQATAPRYHCPMHPSIVQDHSGDCPICSMSLVPFDDEAAPAASTRPAEQGRADAGSTAAGAYWCPMHPNVTSDDPAARCPDCGGMKLVPRPGAIPPDAGVVATHDTAVPGLVPIELKPERIQLIGMKTAVARLSAVTDELRAVGFVSADEQRISQVTTRFAGWIETLGVNETGQKVKRGQVLAAIYSPELLNAQNELLNARKWSAAGDARQTSTAVAGGLAADARTKLKLMGVAEHELEQLEQTGQPVRALPLRSAVDGYVIAKNALQGGYVQPGVELFRIADLSRVWVLADVYEYEVSRVRRGQQASISLVAYPGRKFEGKVGYVYPTVESATRTVRVRLEVKNPKLELRPGMYGEVVVTGGGGREVVLVPREAVVDSGELQYVFMASGDGRFEPRRVTVGARSGDDVQIVSGVSPGEAVVTTGNFLLDSESSLRFRVSGPSFSQSGADAGANAAPQSGCAADFDKDKFPEKYEQCLACEQQHRGMGSMEEDCKKTVPRPWK